MSDVHTSPSQSLEKAESKLSECRTKLAISAEESLALAQEARVQLHLASLDAAEAAHEVINEARARLRRIKELAKQLAERGEARTTQVLNEVGEVAGDLSQRLGL